MASYNIKQEHTVEVSRNKQNRSKRTLKKSRKSRKIGENAKKCKIIAYPRHNYSISPNTHCEEHADVV